jgi:NAD-dependent deacetylase
MSDDPPKETVEPYSKEMIDKAAKIILESKNLVVMTGAGISTESGVPDFRSPDTGLWTKITPEESRKIFTDPKIFWKIVREMGPKIIKAKPSKSHEVIAKLEKLKIVKTIITQNIDNLHQASGSPFILELHGNATEFMCMFCHNRVDAKKIIKEHRQEDDNLLASCPSCGGAMILDVVLFEQNLSKGVWLESVAQAQTSDVFLVIGSSLMVAPANQLPLYALKYNSKLIIINNAPTDLDPEAFLVLRGQCGEIMEDLYKKIKKLLKIKE